MPHLRYSIVIPTYRRSEVLPRCCAALRRELRGATNAEVIVVNDGGPAEAAESAAASLEPVRSRVLHVPHRGVSAARNSGVQAAEGPIIICLDDDCVPAPGWFRSLEEAWSRHPNADVIGGAYALKEGQTLLSIISLDLMEFCIHHLQSAGRCGFLPAGNISFKKTAFSAVSGFDERFVYGGEDKDFYLSLASTGIELMMDRDIRVFHDDLISVKGFIRRHFGYGLGAYLFFLKHRHHPDYRPFTPQVILRLLVFAAARHRKLIDKASCVFLLCLAQACTTAGFLRMLWPFPAHPWRVNVERQ